MGLQYLGQVAGGVITDQTLAEIIQVSTIPFDLPVNGLTALAGGGQAGATALAPGINRITTVAAGNDSVLLPKSYPGAIVLVKNAAAANSANVYPATGEVINALGANNPFALAAGKFAMFVCGVLGTWDAMLTA
jgi:hypothetical protein